MKLSRRTFLGTTGAAGAVAAWGLKPAPADAATGPRFDRGLLLPGPESVLRGLGYFIDAHDGLATLLDGDFRVVRTSRSHQVLLKYDPTEMYAKSSERFWSREMRSVIEGIGGLRDFRRLGVYSIDFTLVREPYECGFGNEQALVAVGRTVAIGDPRDPMAYLTACQLAEAPTIGSSAVITCLADSI